MTPTAAVSGWYFSHPESKYFGTGSIKEDQLVDYAERKNDDIAKTRRWLAPILDD